MAPKNNPQKVPLIYAYLYMKIKKQMRGGRINGSNIRKIIQRVILCEKDGGTKGIPRRYSHDIIKDLINLGLIEKVGMIHRKAIYEDKDEKVSEVVERLKDWKITEKIRKDKSVKKNLGPMIDILDKEPFYRKTKSNCDKEIRDAFW